MTLPPVLLLLLLLLVIMLLLLLHMLLLLHYRQASGVLVRPGCWLETPALWMQQLRCQQQALAAEGRVQSLGRQRHRVCP